MYAAYLLLQIINENPKLNNDTGFSQFWNVILNPNKAIFLNEKCLFQFTDEGYIVNIIKSNLYNVIIYIFFCYSIE